MATRTAETSPLSVARLAGFLYLLDIPRGIFGGLSVASRLVVSGDGAATANNIMASELLFRLGIVSNLLSPIVMLLVALVLYQLLKPVNQIMALLMVSFVVIGVPIAMLNDLNHLAVLQLLSGADYLKVFTADQLNALVLLFLRLHSRGGTIAFIFWGLWLFPLGYLVFKSGFIPKILGILLMIGCFGYLVDSFAAFLLPDSKVSIALFTFWGEVLFPSWLLIKGVNVEQWKQRAAESARSERLGTSFEPAPG